MRQTPVTLVFLIIAILAWCVQNTALAQERSAPDPCTLLSKADIETVIGQKAGDGTVNPSANPQAGSPCQYIVGSGGVFSILIKKAASDEKAAKVMEELKKRNIPVSEAPGIGDHSFFSSPGYGMVQLNTFKEAHYLIITMLVPGATEANQKTAAAALMAKALTHL